MTTTATTTTTTANGTALIRPIRPAADIIERPNDWVVVLDVPGADVQQLEVVLESQELRIAAPVRMPEQEGDRQIQRERPRGIYLRSFRLGEEADANGIDAELRHGVLVLTVKKTAKATPRRIQVRHTDDQNK